MVRRELGSSVRVIVAGKEGGGGLGPGGKRRFWAKFRVVDLKKSGRGYMGAFSGRACSWEVLVSLFDVS